MNPMKEIKVEKITLNIGTGKPGPQLEKAVKLLELIAERKPVEAKTQKRIPTWALRPGLSIGTMVTLRGKQAEELLKRLFQAIDNKMHSYKIGKDGNFAFGIKEYIDIPGIKYNMDIGMMGLEVAVTLKRAGFRLKKRKIMPRKLPDRHKIHKDETKLFLQQKYGIKFDEEK
ncbi:MAG: 50S ribosomal protein L5 [Candidatus Nanoarchaeia archaeon]|nr:50S ribosomal protein L5 [Candidatus Nanoarchaeia archaeon]